MSKSENAGTSVKELSESEMNDLVTELRRAYDMWKAFPEDKKTFNTNWLQKNGFFGLYERLYKHGGVERFVALAGDEVQKDYKKKLSFTSDLAVAELSAAHVEWQKEPEDDRPVFNIAWLQKNGHVTLSRWMRKNGGAQHFATVAGGTVAEDFEVSRVVKRTETNTVEDLRSAHKTWKSLPPAERGTFNSNWLRNNGYSGVEAWMAENGGALHFANLIGGEVAKDFENNVGEERSIDSALDELRAAHSAWRALPETERGSFNYAWLIDNGYRGLVDWAGKHFQDNGLLQLASLAGGTVAEDFEVSRVVKRTETNTVEDLRSAHKTWKSLPPAERGTFNSRWLQKNGYAGIAGWMAENGGTLHFAALAGSEIVEDFKKRIDNWTPDSAVTQLRVAHADWKKKSSDVEHGSFNTTWLEDNGYGGLYNWLRTNGGALHFVTLAGGDVAKDFENNSGVERTVESAVAELALAHTAWKELPEDERPSFSSKWLRENNYSRLDKWIRGHGGIDSFVELAGGSVSDDFKRLKVDGLNEEVVLNELLIAHAAWETLSEGERGSFNADWLLNNGFAPVYYWMAKNGGIRYFIMLAGGEVMRDYEQTGMTIEHGQLKKQFLDYIRDLKESGLELDDFKAYLNVLGASEVVDIIYSIHPEFKGIPVEYVKGIAPEYLGDFLVVKREFKLRDAAMVAAKLPDAGLSIQDRFREGLKRHFLQYYFSQSHHKHGGSADIIYAYIDHAMGEFGSSRSTWLDNVLQDVVAYYDSVLREFHKPEGFVDELAPGREFPDINQRINMKELADKKRLLIADEMGLGKSASVIMAKEQLHVKCALVVAPSNVLDTWKGYLSERNTKEQESTEKKSDNYFAPGKAPRVLRVESIEDIEGVTADQYDYILISQEKMTDKYTPILQKLDYDMLIIDEVHKIKNPNAVRTQGLLPLAEKIQGDNKYLALLSGTPVPNKIRDVGTVLRLLYPDKFSEIDDADLTQMIIRGDIVKLRELLLPRMQMKSLEDGVEMPELHDEPVEVELSPIEKEIYEVLLEEDELTANEKIQIMRQFLLNPELVDATPGFEGAKVKAVREEIHEAFQEHDKVVGFVNDYIEGIIRGDKNIIAQLDIPSDVTVETIEGEVETAERGDIERRFQKTEERMLLLVSGKTADVGINLSRGQRGLMINEPWTESDRQQQIARLYRFGLRDDLTFKTFIIRGTIEEGMHDYIRRKDRAVQKLFHGVPLSELEQNMLIQDEKRSGAPGPDQQITPEFAQYYFSSWERLKQYFVYSKEVGEEKFNVFLEKHGTDYAQAYKDMGSRSYQSNVNRITGTLIKKFAENSEQDPRRVKILDLASGPEMLRNHISDELQPSVTSMDLNQQHFPWEEVEEGRRIVGSWTELPSPNIAPSSMDYVNLAMSIHYSRLAPSRGDYERVQVLQSVNRVLKSGGKAVISMIYSLEIGNMDTFKQAVEVLGFKVVDGYTGTVEAGNQFSSQVITLEKIADATGTPEEAVEKMGESYDGLKFSNTEKELKGSRNNVLKAFTLGEHGYITELNEQDKAILREETEINEEGRRLKSQYSDIKSIPATEVIDNHFVRILVGKKYQLFKKLKSGPGAVVIK